VPLSPFSLHTHAHTQGLSFSFPLLFVVFLAYLSHIQTQRHTHFLLFCWYTHTHFRPHRSLRASRVVVAAAAAAAEAAAAAAATAAAMFLSWFPIHTHTRPQDMQTSLFSPFPFVVKLLCGMKSRQATARCHRASCLSIHIVVLSTNKAHAYTQSVVFTYTTHNDASSHLYLILPLLFSFFAFPLQRKVTKAHTIAHPIFSKHDAPPHPSLPPPTVPRPNPQSLLLLPHALGNDR